MKNLIILFVLILILPAAKFAQYNGGFGSGYSSSIFTEGPLPVELVSFKADIKNNTVLLFWNTATEIENYGFEVQRRSERNTYWEKAGFVLGRGNINSSVEYSFNEKIKSDGAFFYRLKQIDNDGTFTFSQELKVNVIRPTSIELRQNFPNPFNPSTNITFTLNKSLDIKLLVYNITGEQVAVLVDEKLNAGYHNITFDASNYNSGIYFYRLAIEGSIITKKMILLK
ncbi:MAG: T9SS type A sorting domain-containing protein [Ignavibacteriae bacterium]|nr:T9SS C-terminal target domain-containing protein [Ignavibacteriota bacterium]NOH00051.1 T9SS type A sorting domain-containing protein [Ignavibacteriota bacterium]